MKFHQRHFSFIEAAVMSSLANKTPEGKSISELGKDCQQQKK